ncbi:Phage terminase large subunit (GpA) [Poriferisphaera corsica]|uniref:Phage terminase large subunit (GpA) n=1 Tax=Poriferisphaera corsica TaxID=2528020 RepID=A0A517YS35_9BACT|nr:terminase gpA endonuclease subunit [Poriferisphaera corsica]QDU33039.1 Phage terminase large subunit (GpA) [Poriferisphaera corsica]
MNLRKLKPAELLRVINSTRFGNVLSESQLRRHRNMAGYTIGDVRSIDLLRYAAWLTLQYSQEIKQSGGYEQHKKRMAEQAAEMVRSAQDIGVLPEVADPERKKNATESFRGLCETYFPEVFYLPWSADHEKVISKIEKAVTSGGLFAVAMPRGSGKTVLMQMACLWAALTGATPFVCLIAASADRAKDLLENIKVWLETNPLLAADFPEVCYPIKALERITNRQKGQKFQGEPTRIEWAADKIVLPTIPGSKASGVVISCSGMKGSDLRGQNHARPDGQVVRPALVMVDDPQTTESAWSPSQSQRREAILAGDVLGMAGPSKKIAGLMACTVIRPGDMADNMLDRQKHPEWQGQRTKMVYKFPSNEKLWATYAQIRADSLRNDSDGSEATKFYQENQVAMDEGAVVAWPQRFYEGELSAIQHAMNLKLRDDAAFFAEYQNEPIVETEGEEMLTPEEIAKKTNGYLPGAVPIGCNHLTMFIDVQQKVLFWMICGWEDDFTGYVLDYGVWPSPDPGRHYFALANLQNTLAKAKPGAGLEGQIYHGLEQLTLQTLSRIYRREDGAEMHINRCMIDANWGQSTDVVYQFCRQSEFATILLPSHGKYVGASSTPFSEYKRKRGDRIGHHWRIPNITGRRQVRHALVDTNYWKSFVHARLSVAMGDPGCLSLYGRDTERHRLLADHMTAEYRVKTLARGRVVDEWKLKAARPDNHWLDCLVGCAVGASMMGASLPGTNAVVKQTAKRLRLSGLQHKKARQKRG